MCNQSLIVIKHGTCAGRTSYSFVVIFFVMMQDALCLGLVLLATIFEMTTLYPFLY